MMYGDASPHEYRQTLVESYLNHYSKEVESLDEASTLSSVQARDYIDWSTISVYSEMLIYRIQSPNKSKHTLVNKHF